MDGLIYLHPVKIGGFFSSALVSDAEAISKCSSGGARGETDAEVVSVVRHDLTQLLGTRLGAAAQKNPLLSSFRTGMRPLRQY